MYKVWIKGVGESTYATNDREFNTIEEAKSHAIDLWSRWFGAESYAVLPKSEEFKGFLSQDVVDCNAVLTGG